MTDEKEIQDSQPDEQEDVTSEELETPEESNDDTGSDDSELADKNKQLFQRAKKAEAEAKVLKEQLAKSKVEEKPVTTSTVTLDEVVLLKEYDIDDLTMLKTIQAGNKSLGKEMSLPQAKDSVLFQAYIKEKKAKVRQEKAQLPASNKSLNVNKDGKPLSREEHQAVFNKLVNK